MSAQTHREQQQPTLSDDAIDPSAFEALRQKALRCLGTDGALAEKLSPVISGLAADSQGVAELQVGPVELSIYLEN